MLNTETDVHLISRRPTEITFNAIQSVLTVPSFDKLYSAWPLIFICLFAFFQRFEKYLEIL